MSCIYFMDIVRVFNYFYKISIYLRSTGPILAKKCMCILICIVNVNNNKWILTRHLSIHPFFIKHQHIINIFYYCNLTKSPAEYFLNNVLTLVNLFSFTVTLFYEWANPDRTGYGLSNSQNPQGIPTFYWLPRQERNHFQSTQTHTCLVISVKIFWPVM